MTEQEIVAFLYKIINHEQLQIPATQARLLVAAQDWLKEKGADDGTEKQQSA